MTPLWFWELPKRDMGVWAPVYRWYDHWYGCAIHQRPDRLHRVSALRSVREKPISWVMIG